jgi:hypothetical protein
LSGFSSSGHSILGSTCRIIGIGLVHVICLNFSNSIGIIIGNEIPFIIGRRIADEKVLIASQLCI